MKIAFFSDTYHPTVDGVVRTIDNYSEELRKRGHEVIVFAPAPKNKEDREKGVIYFDSITFSPYPQYRIPYKAPVGFDRAQKKIEEFKPDIIHCHAMAAMSLPAIHYAKKTNTPIIATFHTMLPRAVHYIVKNQGLQDWAAHFSWRYIKWLYPKFDITTAPSKYIIDILDKKEIKAELLPNPIDTRKFRPGKNNKKVRVWIPKNANVILFFGRVAKEKNLDFLIKIAQLEDFDKWGGYFLIAGDGPYRKTLQDTVKRKRLEKKIKFAGKIEDKLVPSFYRSALCTIIPSKFETQGLVALESLGCATPVIAMRDTALEEVVIADKTGGIIGEDAQNAFRVIVEVIKNRKRLGAGGHKLAQKYSNKKCTDKLLKYYKKIIDKKRK